MSDFVKAKPDDLPDNSWLSDPERVGAVKEIDDEGKKLESADVKEQFEAVSTGRDGEIQDFEVPVSGKYKITAKGAEGGDGGADYSPGLGAVMQGDIHLEEGEELKILVGQKGVDVEDIDGNPGGGGTFVVRVSDEETEFQMQDGPYVEPLIVAGGGGGSWDNSPIPYENRHGRTWHEGTSGGTDWGDGGSGEGAGGGFTGTGEEDGSDPTGGGSFLYGYQGGGNDGVEGDGNHGIGGTDNSGGDGGFGGGGGYGSFNYGSGGGGYDGGDFCPYGEDSCYSGGGSYLCGEIENAATSDGDWSTTDDSAYDGPVENLQERNHGHGEVIIELQESKGYRVSKGYQPGLIAGENSISWTSEEPENTEVKMFYAITEEYDPPEVDGGWNELTNGESFLEKGADLREGYLWFKQELHGTEEDSPTLETQEVSIEDDGMILTMEVDGGGQVDPEEGEHAYYKGTDVKIEVVHVRGWSFVEWTGDHEGTEEEATITMDEDKFITAHFEALVLYELTINIIGNGETDPEEGRHVFYDTETVEIESLPLEHWYLEEWTGDYESDEETLVFEMKDDTEVTAHFMQERPVAIEAGGKET